MYDYAGSVDDWLVIKKELLKCLPPRLRRDFSRRDEKTKKQTLNDFDIAVAQEWSRLSKKPVFFRNGETKQIAP